MKKIHKLAVAVSLALVAGNAAADFTNDWSNPAGTVQSSSLIFTAVDDNLNSANFGATFVYDLALGDSGLNYASFLNGTQGTSGTLSWNLSSVSAFSAFAADNSDLQWTIQAGQGLVGGVGGTDPNLSTWGVLSTESGGTSAFSTLVTNVDKATNATGTVTAWIGSVNNYLDANSISTNVAAISAGAVTDPSTLGNLQVSGSIFALGSSSIAFYDVTNAVTSTRHPANNVVTDLGTFSLSAGNTLTYSNASAVPLPAATWLFLSGLLGMLGLKRRQSSVTA